MTPSFLVRYAEQGRALIQKGEVKDLEFSRATYQVQVGDQWAFLSFSEGKELRDAFCSCTEWERAHACPHLAAAYLTICPGEGPPLHRLFRHSFWRALFLAVAKKAEFQFLIKRKGGLYVWEPYVEIKGKSVAWRERLRLLIDEFQEAKEETSLKFSNLSPEELNLWKQGTPSQALRFELSVWSDLAKALFLEEQLRHPLEMAFSWEKEELPLILEAKGKEVRVGVHLEPAWLEALVPTLDQVRSNLELHRFEGNKISSLTFDRKKGQFEVNWNPEYREWFTQLPKSEVYPLGKWWWVPADGFYPREGESWESGSVVGLLEAWGIGLNRYLQGEEVHEAAIQPRYRLSVEAQTGLTIAAYLFEEGDLQRPGARLFENWAYLPDKGFFPLWEKRFDEGVTSIPPGEVGAFVSLNRHWLNGYEGFHVHVATIETLLSYQVDVQGYLSFYSHLASPVEGEEAIDFGSWVYLEGQGFFAKSQNAPGHHFHTLEPIPPERISSFIRAHRGELEQVAGFFSSRHLVEADGVEIEVNARGQVEVTPQYRPCPGVPAGELLVFADYVYWRKEGFHSLPTDRRLPEKYWKPLTIPPKQVVSFIRSDLEALRPYATTMDRRLQTPTHLRLVLTEGEAVAQGARFHLSYRSDQGQESLASVWRALARHQPYHLGSAGCLDLSQPRFQWLRTLSKEAVEGSDGLVDLRVLDLLRLLAFEEVQPVGEEGKAAFHLLDQWVQFSPPDLPQLEGLSCSLRPYQQLGVEWLWFLYRYGLSGLLCDDMGLGKTHQAMGLMAAVRHHLGDREGPLFLVVCPTSVVYHWKEKLAQFLPDLRVYFYYGAGRDLEELQRSNYDVVLTSYGILRLESERLKAFSFEVAIYDEVQIAKNHQSQIHSVLKGIPGQMRLGLTGTPIENRLMELKALFDVILPGYMPSDSHYREFFIQPIEVQEDKERKALLARTIRPFILRRRKSEVLQDLPEKSEEVHHCELYPEQLSLYNELKEQSRPWLQDALAHEKQPVPYLHIFALLSKLKQVCDHPALYHRDVANYHRYSSGKWELFKELLKEALDSEQKVVVFTQYLGMLDILCQHCDEEGIPYATVRGSTTHRQKQLALFQEDPACRVFLGSLQAVGLGVDLTAGSVVIHYDRWWNPARESQATDRVHRIGQIRGVQVYKLVTLDTVEEHIDDMIQRKKRLAEEVLSTDDEGLLKMLDRDELLALFQNI